MRTSSRTACLALGLALPFVVAAPAVAGGGVTYRGTVVDVIDGDSLTVSPDGESSTIEVRLIGVDAPSGGCASRESTAFATSALEGEDVRLRIDKKRDESDSRLFAYVYDGGRMFNLETIRAGYGKVRTYGGFGADQQFTSRFQQAEQQARSSDSGLWDDGAFPVC